MVIKNAEFVVSNTRVSKCPEGNMPEYAFIGRSNVGKSSLINMLTNRKKLAMTSSKPGKTKLINHFIINNTWYLVDLPGYGYASTGKTEREKFSKLISSYILNRTQLTSLFVLIDSRHEPQKIDIEFINWVGENHVPLSIVFTKADKISGHKVKTNMQAFEEELHKSWQEIPPVFVTSSVDLRGKDELLQYIDQVNKALDEPL